MLAAAQLKQIKSSITSHRLDPRKPSPSFPRFHFCTRFLLAGRLGGPRQGPLSFVLCLCLLACAFNFKQTLHSHLHLGDHTGHRKFAENAGSQPCASIHVQVHVHVSWCAQAGKNDMICNVLGWWLVALGPLLSSCFPPSPLPTWPPSLSLSLLDFCFTMKCRDDLVSTMSIWHDLCLFLSHSTLCACFVFDLKFEFDSRCVQRFAFLC